MKKVTRLFSLIVMVASVLIMAGCSDNDGGPKMNYAKMRLGRMDLKGAVSLGLSKGRSGSRAIDGEYLSAGLYKVDASGNISAVAVYFTTDTEGNRLEHEEKLRIVPYKMFNLTDNYMLFAGCRYYDSDGDMVQDQLDNDKITYQDVPYIDLLVRKSDGKIWCVDKISSKFFVGYYEWLTGEFIGNSHGNLYFVGDYVYKFNLNNAEPSFEQISPDRISADNLYITEKDIMLRWGSSNGGGFADLFIQWPQSGFQKVETENIIGWMKDIPRIELPGEYSYRGEVYKDFYMTTFNNNWNEYYFFTMNDKPYVLVSFAMNVFRSGRGSYSSNSFKDDDWLKIWENMIEYARPLYPVCRLYSIEVGSAPGSAKLSEKYWELTGAPESVFTDQHDFLSGVGSVYVGNGYILTSDHAADKTTFGNNGKEGWITYLDLNSGEWKWLKQLESPISFEDSYSFNGKIWAKSDDTRNLSESPFVGVRWFDPKTLKDGEVAFNYNFPDYMHWKGEPFVDGYAVFSGTNPSNSNEEIIRFDLLTGSPVEEVIKPEYYFETLIPLN